MRHRISGMLLGLMMGTAVLGGCAKTPEESLVKQKGEASLKNYQEADDLEADGQADTQAGGNTDVWETEANEAGAYALRKVLGAPEHYQSNVTDATGKLQIVTDAEVEIPDARKVPSIAVTQCLFDQAAIDRITDTFFPEAEIYSASSYYVQTKADYQEKLEALKGYVAEGNLDPFCYGTDENGNYVYDIYGQIELTEQKYQEAPEDKELEEVHPQFGLEESYSDYFGGVACQPDGSAYNYTMQSYENMPMEVQIEKIRQPKKYGAMVSWIEYKGYKASTPEVPDEEEVRAAIGMTLEEAEKIADEKVAALGLDSMELTSWEYALCMEEGDGSVRERQQDAGYELHYTRRLNGIPITYTMEWGGNLESMDSDMETWDYERLDFIITKDGIDTVKFIDQYDIGEVQTENLKLLTFDKIMEIYEKMMVIQNADIMNYELSRTYCIDRIAFGYSRIYEPASDSRSGLLVPVWDFFGSFEARSEDQETQYDTVNAAQYQSYLTINAVDGSTIDRGLGY